MSARTGPARVDTDRTGTTRSRLRLGPLSLVVLLVGALIATASYLATRQVVNDQEHKLLKQRTDEAALYLSSIIGTVQSSLTSVATSSDPAQFKRAARLLTLTPNGFSTVALVKVGAPPTLVAYSGKALPTVATGPRATAIMGATAKAGFTGALFSTPTIRAADGTRSLGFAYAPVTLRGYVVYAESTIRPQSQSQTTSGQPFSELAVALYTGPKIQADQLLTTSPGYTAPLHGDVASAKSPIGQGPPWLLVAKARHPLVGSVATATPWALLFAALVAAMLAAGIVETLARRREYALSVADVATQDLSASITELAAAQEQLVRSERLAAIGELASTVGHELRNPLGVISNALFLLRGDVGENPPDATQRHLATAEREVSVATVIVADLLEFARQREPVHTDVDAVNLVDEVIAVAPPPTGITVRRDLPDTPEIFPADRDMIRQVLINLVGNAYQAMPTGGELTMSISSDAARLRISVTDTGEGMTPEVVARVFEPFYTTKARGVGLGLAVSKRIVDAHGGEFEVTSTPGEGTTFVLALPRVTVPRQQVVQDAPASAEARS